MIILINLMRSLFKIALFGAVVGIALRYFRHPLWAGLGIFGSLLLTVVMIIAIGSRNTWKRFTHYRQQHRGKLFLLISSRHGWKQFFQNNIQPALPTNVSVVWQHPSRSNLSKEADDLRKAIQYTEELAKCTSAPSRFSLIYAGLEFQQTCTQQNPCLVLITEGDIQVLSLHESILSLRRTSEMKREETQMRIREIIDYTVKKLEASNHRIERPAAR